MPESRVLIAYDHIYSSGLLLASNAFSFLKHQCLLQRLLFMHYVFKYLKFNFIIRATSESPQFYLIIKLFVVVTKGIFQHHSSKAKIFCIHSFWWPSFYTYTLQLGCLWPSQHVPLKSLYLKIFFRFLIVILLRRK